MFHETFATEKSCVNVSQSNCSALFLDMEGELQVECKIHPACDNQKISEAKF